MKDHRRSSVCCIIPPYLFLKLLENSDREIRDSALNSLLATAHMRGQRSVRATFGVSSAPANGQRTIFNCQHSTDLATATVIRTEDGSASTDESVNRAFEGFGTTRDFYKEVFDRNSIDDHGMRLDGYVHRGTNFNNAFWDGQEMVFGDGDGVRFTDFTKSIDVIAHELTHGVTEYTANLIYHNQQGALNESISDVFGSLVKQWSLGQNADTADWLIGAEIFTPGIGGDALRSMKAPGTAYDNSLFGKDPQPDHMNKFVHLPDTQAGDSGGVHYNSGIPNKAFYLTAVGIGGAAWQAAGHIWYQSLLASNQSSAFQDFADTTYSKAGELYGTGSHEQQAVQTAWREVGIRISGGQVGGGRGRGSQLNGVHGGDSLAALTKQIESLSAQVKALTKDIGALKGKK